MLKSGNKLEDYNCNLFYICQKNRTMKKRVLVFMFLLGASCLTFGQMDNIPGIKISESKEFKEKHKTYGVLSLNTSKSGKTSLVRSGKKKFVLDVFDKGFNKTFSKVIKVEKKEWYEGDLFFENELKFFSVYSPKRKERELFCHSFNLEDNSYKKTKLFSTSIKRSGSLFRAKNKNITSFAASPNGKYFVIASQDEKQSVNSSIVRVYNSKTLELLYKKTYHSNEDRHYSHNDLIIDDSAVVYSLGKLYLGGSFSKRFNGDANYQFVLTKITKTETKELMVDLGAEHIKSLTISNTNNELSLLGFYSEKNIYRLKGACSFLIDTESFQVKSKKINELPLKVYEDLYSKRRASKKKKKGKELRNFYIDYVLEGENGSTYLLAEEFYVTQTYVMNANGGGYYVTTYHYDDVLILKLNSSGELDWGRSIYKRANRPSYNAFVKNNELHVVLNSGKKLKEKKDGRTKAGRNLFGATSLYDFVYDENGEVKHYKIKDNKLTNSYVPYSGTYENNKFIMMSSKKSKKKFMIIE